MVKGEARSSPFTMNKTLLPIISVIALFSSCAPLGLYRTSDLTREIEIAEKRGFAAGQSREVYRQELERELEKTRPHPISEYYELPMPAHTTPDGVNIASHDSIQKFHTK